MCARVRVGFLSHAPVLLCGTPVVQACPACISSLARYAFARSHDAYDGVDVMTRGDDVAHAGGSIAYGCVQEEIMFACHPELNCARLVFTPMLANEAFILCGAEQFAMPRGYAFGLECAGPYHPVACLPSAVLHSARIACFRSCFFHHPSSCWYSEVARSSLGDPSEI